MKIESSGNPDSTTDVKRLRESEHARKAELAEEPQDQKPLEDSVSTSGVAAAMKAQDQKIEQLRLAVQSGAYSVPARDIAAKIVADRLDDAAEQS